MTGTFFFERDAAGVTASHPLQTVLPVLAAPVPEDEKAKHFNAIREPLVVIGCKELPSNHFEFDSSFVLPNSVRAFTVFKRLLDLLQEQDEQGRRPPSAVFGHADPTGKVGYNRMLSGRRATAVYAVLTKDTALWEKLFSAGYGGDVWGDKAIQNMLSISLIVLQPSGLPEAPFYLGDIDGAKTPATRKQTNEAISAWREARGFGKGTVLSATHRKKLFQEYMDVICNGPDFKLDKTDFIAKGQSSADLRGDVMGCGEFNPRFLLTAEFVKLAQKDKLLREIRDESYEVNRRAILFVFKHGTEIDPKKWPCPAARSEADGPCKTRFWSDGEKRRAEAEAERTFGEQMTHLDADDQGKLVETPIGETGNTMGCRFYHGFARYSPCEAKLQEWVVRFKTPTFNGRLQTLANRRFIAIVGESESAPEIRGSTDDGGFIRLPVLSEHTKITVRLDARIGSVDDEAQAPTKEDHFQTLHFDAGRLEVRDTDNDLGIKQRLYNMGYGEQPPDQWTKAQFERALARFARRNGLAGSASDTEVRERIVLVHDLVGKPEKSTAEQAEEEATATAAPQDLDAAAQADPTDPPPASKA